jgi:F0F1-type ATP synthase assembly protein I
MDGGQVLGGGVIVLVAVALWLVYLLPTLINRSRYDAAERNALRLSRALRVLAETTETPEEVRVELTARQAHLQQKLARRAQAEVERLRRERERIAAEEQRLERERERQELERRRRALEAAQRALHAERRRARARRGVRLGALGGVLVGVALAAWGTVAFAAGPWLLLSGLALAALGVGVLNRMARVVRRARPVPMATAPPVRRAAVEPQLMNPKDRGWTPRTLPAPLVATAGSRAATTVAAQSARDALLQAAREDALRARAEEPLPAPVPIAEARPAAAPETAPAAAESPYARMGIVDDAEIEDHVRRLLERRAAS